MRDSPSCPGPRPSPPSLALVSSSNGGATWSSSLTILHGVKCGATCNPHSAWAGGRLVVAFLGSEGVAVITTADPTGRQGWTEPRSLEPWLGAAWAKQSMPGPGAALAIKLPASQGAGGRRDRADRLIFCGHGRACTQDLAWYSDDLGETFNVSASTPYDPADNALAGMDECGLAQLANGKQLEQVAMMTLSIATPPPHHHPARSPTYPPTHPVMPFAPPIAGSPHVPRATSRSTAVCF